MLLSWSYLLDSCRRSTFSIASFIFRLSLFSTSTTKKTFYIPHRQIQNAVLHRDHSYSGRRRHRQPHRYGSLFPIWGILMNTSNQVINILTPIYRPCQAPGYWSRYPCQHCCHGRCQRQRRALQLQGRPPGRQARSLHQEKLLKRGYRIEFGVMG